MRLTIVSLIVGMAASTALAFSCSSDLDCMLNGVCSDGACTCDPVWTGDDCSQLHFKPNAVDYMAQGYGQSTSVNISTWGGNAVLGSDGLYHLFVAEMVNGCPLSDWGHNSRVSHATSKTIDGPYEYHDTAVDVWSHNPQVVEWEEDGKTQYALFHIGSGVGGHPSTCGSSDSASVSDASDGGSTLHTATSPYGPWTPVANPPSGCNNPAPMRMSNGTWFVICGSSSLRRSDSLTGGSWEPVATTPRAGITGSGIHFEDAFLYTDSRGGFHVLYHVYNMTVPCGDCPGTIVSGHDFSEDGLSWHSAPGQPFDNTYTTTSGKTITVSTRERPKLLFNADGVPTHLVSGVSDVPSCPPDHASHCKQSNPGWWTYTLVAPLITA